MFKKGQRVVQVISGFGTKTANIQVVGKVEKKKNRVWLEDNSTNEYDLKTGREVNPPIPGFTTELVLCFLLEGLGLDKNADVAGTRSRYFRDKSTKL